MEVIIERELGEIFKTLRGKRVVAGSHAVTPWRALSILDAAVDEYTLFILNARKGVPTRTGVTLETPFIGPGMRNVPGLKYYPRRLSLVSRMLERDLPVDAVIVQARYDNGKLSLGLDVNILPAVIESVRKRGGIVVAQLNENVPFTYGDGELGLAQVDYAITYNAALETHPVASAADLDKTTQQIAANVAQLIPERATLQIGIGAIPDAVLSTLVKRSELRIWSEMISDGVMQLERAGALDRKLPIATTFAIGSAEFYRWMDHNRRIEMRRTETVNDPGMIAYQQRMIALNTALQVDLFGQANASFVNGRWYSGFGGQPDFTVGALHSGGGLSIIALASWHKKAKRSTIVPSLTNPATSFQHSYIVTEYGAAKVSGADTTTQALNLISVAHPEAREALTQTLADESREAA